MSATSPVSIPGGRIVGQESHPHSHFREHRLFVTREEVNAHLHGRLAAVGAGQDTADLAGEHAAGNGVHGNRRPLPRFDSFQLRFGHVDFCLQ